MPHATLPCAPHPAFRGCTHHVTRAPARHACALQVEAFVQNPAFDPVVVMRSSRPAAVLGKWVIAIDHYRRIKRVRWWMWVIAIDHYRRIKRVRWWKWVIAIDHYRRIKRVRWWEWVIAIDHYRRVKRVRWWKWVIAIDHYRRIKRVHWWKWVIAIDHYQRIKRVCALAAAAAADTSCLCALGRAPLDEHAQRWTVPPHYDRCWAPSARRCVWQSRGCRRRRAHSLGGTQVLVQ